ncbi:hypothetical protein [Lujinxingia litoralis]|nr:hypothetical protein [Lujinxingia litoralis]
MRWSVGVVISIWVAMMPLALSAQHLAPVVWSEPGDRSTVVVMALSAEEADLQARDHVRRSLESWSSLRMVDAPEALPEVDEADKQTWIERKEAAERAYFYQGAEAARAMLEQPVEQALKQVELWGGDPEFAEAVQYAALYLARALLDLEEPELARALTARLTELFVAQSVLGQRWPPELAQVWEEARASLAGDDAWMNLRAVEGWECPLYINGQRVHVQRLRVRPGGRYVLSSHCADPAPGMPDPAAWSVVGRAPGENRYVYWPGAFAAEAPNEDGLAAAAATLGVEVVVVVGKSARCSEGAEAGDGEICVWSSSAEEDARYAPGEGAAAQRSLGAILPELYARAGAPGMMPVTEPPKPSVARRGAIIGSSSALVAGAAWMGWALMESHRYRCSAQTGGDSFMSCEGTQALHFESDAERLASARANHLHRLGAGITMGLGAAVLGAVLLKGSARERPMPAGAPALEVGFSRDAASVQVRGRF